MPFGLDRPYWIRDENFDIEYHVRQIALLAPGTWRQFCTQVARLCERPLDMSRPPWEMYIVEGLDSIVGVPKGAFAMVLKLHHAAVDGVGGAEMISVLHDKSADISHSSVELASPPLWAAERAPSNLELLTRAGLNAVIRPVGFIGNVVPSVRRIPSSLRRSRGDAPRGLGAVIASTRFNAHRVFGAVRFELPSVKLIKNSVNGAKVNDVALALVGGALRRYLDDKGELPREPLVALMPISIRPTMTQRPRESDVEASAGGNRFAMLPISMATDIRDPIERLRTIQRTTSLAKGVDAASAQTLTDLSESCHEPCWGASNVPSSEPPTDGDARLACTRW